MRRILHLAVAFFPIVVAACASPNYSYRPTSTEISLPEIGSISTVGVGDIMLRQGRYVESDAIHVLQTITVAGLGSYTFSPGYYTKVLTFSPKTVAFFE